MVRVLFKGAFYYTHPRLPARTIQGRVLFGVRVLIKEIRYILFVIKRYFICFYSQLIYLLASGLADEVLLDVSCTFGKCIVNLSIVVFSRLSVSVVIRVVLLTKRCFLLDRLAHNCWFIGLRYLFN